ncbi:MAG: hypothetical protein ACRD2T_06265, partial [Thermoanaerobaculia bacterium]
MCDSSLLSLLGCALAALFCVVAPSPAREAVAAPVASPVPPLAAPDDEGDDDGEDDPDEGDDGKDGKKGKDDDDDSDPEPKPEDFPEPSDDFSKPSPLEHDRTSPRFVAKDLPSFVILRPGAAAGAKGARPGAKKAAGKDPPVDGSLWGFVDFEARKRRIGGQFDQEIARHEKVMKDEKASEEEREQARKQVVYYTAQKKKRLKEEEKARCQVELVSNPRVYLRIHQQDRPAGVGEKNIRDQFRDRILPQQ